MNYQFHTAEELLTLTKKYAMPIHEVVLRHEMDFSHMTEEQVRERMKKRMGVMKDGILQMREYPKISVSGMSGKATEKIDAFLRHHPHDAAVGETGLRAMLYALATAENNASMGCITAFPTAGSSGIIPGVLFAAQEKYMASDDQLLNALFTASGIGLIIAENATLSGAEGGCQAEVGSATAMAAAAVSEMRGGSPEQCLHAAALALKNMLGLTCDPVGGMVEVPCVKRSALAAVYTLAASDLAIAGIESFIPFDQVLEVMEHIGRLISPQLRETSLGGLAVTATARSVEEKLGITINGANKEGPCGSCAACIPNEV